MPSLVQDRRAFALALQDFENNFKKNVSLFINMTHKLNNSHGQYQNIEPPDNNEVLITHLDSSKPSVLLNLDSKSSEHFYQSVIDLVQSSYHLHSLIANALGYSAEVCAFITHFILLVYCAWQVGKRRKSQYRADIAFGLGLHMSVIGLCFAIFTAVMHSYLLMFFPEEFAPSTQDSPTTILSELPTNPSPFSEEFQKGRNPQGNSTSIAQWRIICRYHLYIRDMVVSLYLFLLVVTLLFYTKVTFPPRVAKNSRWRAIIALAHSLPWVLAVGIALPICVMNLGNNGQPMELIKSFSLLPPSSTPEPPTKTSPIRGTCTLNTKIDLLSTILELFQFTLPILICVGIGLSVFCCQQSNSGTDTTASENHHEVNTTVNLPPHHRISYSRKLLLIMVVMTMLTQVPLNALRMVISFNMVIQGRHTISPIVANYFIQLHLFLFSSTPSLLLLALAMLQNNYLKIERQIEKNHILANNEGGEILLTNCMLTSV